MSTNRVEYDRRYYERNRATIREQKRLNMRKYRALNPGKFRAQGVARNRHVRERLLEMYGRQCALCGFDDARALTLDHVNGNGAEERQRLGERGVYRRALKAHQPDEYRILCMNCQFIARQTAQPAVVRAAWELLK